MGGNNELRAFLETLPHGFYIVDADGRIADANRRACDSLGYTRAELLQLAIADLVSDFDWTAALAEAHHSANPQSPAACLLRHKSGSVFAAQADFGIYEVDGKKRLLLLIREPAAADLAQQRLQRLTRLYQALSEINQAIMRMEDETRLLPLVCRVAVELGGMKMAWIGRPNENGTHLEPVIAYGTGITYLEGIEFPLAPPAPQQPGPAATAWREARNVIVDDFQASVFTAPWHEAAARYGWNSSGSCGTGSPGQASQAGGESRAARDSQCGSQTCRYTGRAAQCTDPGAVAGA